MSFVETFAENGCVTIPQLFDPALIDAIYDEYRGQLGGLRRDELPAHLKVGRRRVQCPIRLTGPLLDPAVYANPILLGILGGLLGPDPVIDNFTVVIAYAGAPQQQFHRDHPDLFLPEAGSRPTAPPFAVTVAIPLIDLTPATGTTEMYPGSHVAELGEGNRPAQLAEPERPYLKRGGCFLMDYRLWHGGMPNASREDRPVLYIVYARHWFTDMANFERHRRIHLEIDDAMTIPPSARRLFRRLAAKGAYDMTVNEWLEQKQEI